LIIERSQDYEKIRAVLTHPEIWEVISGDNDDIDGFTFDAGEDIHIIGYNENNVIGLVNLHYRDKFGWQVHIQVLPEYREKYAEEFGRKVLSYIWKNTRINKLRALIPEIYPNVKKFSELLGFSDEDFITNSYVKGGQVYSKWLMMIERGE